MKQVIHILIIMIISKSVYAGGSDTRPMWNQMVLVAGTAPLAGGVETETMGTDIQVVFDQNAVAAKLLAPQTKSLFDAAIEGTLDAGAAFMGDSTVASNPFAGLSGFTLPDPLTENPLEAFEGSTYDFAGGSDTVYLNMADAGNTPLELAAAAAALNNVQSIRYVGETSDSVYLQLNHRELFVEIKDSELSKANRLLQRIQTSVNGRAAWVSITP